MLNLFFICEETLCFCLVWDPGYHLYSWMYLAVGESWTCVCFVLMWTFAFTLVSELSVFIYFFHSLVLLL